MLPLIIFSVLIALIALSIFLEPENRLFHSTLLLGLVGCLLEFIYVYTSKKYRILEGGIVACCTGVFGMFIFSTLSFRLILLGTLLIAVAFYYLKGA